MSVEAPYLDVDSVSKSFGSIRALDAACFEVRAGEVMALVGENGAGKSTLVKILAGMFPPDDGQIRLGGETIDLGAATRSEHAADRRRAAGALPGAHALDRRQSLPR